MRLKPLRKHDHPDLSDYVIHFVDRPLGGRVDEVPPEILKMDAASRLANIVRDGEIRAFPAFGINDPVVCLSECTQSGVRALVSSGRYTPWGIAFDKNTMLRLGGGPAFYVRGDEWPSVGSMPDQLRFRATRFWPGADADNGENLEWYQATESDWLHEREWRVRGEGNPPLLHIVVEDIAFLIVPMAGFRDRLKALDYRRGRSGRLAETKLVVVDADGVLHSDETGAWAAR